MASGYVLPLSAVGLRDIDKVGGKNAEVARQICTVG